MTSGILQIANKPGHWLLPSSDGKTYHEVQESTGVCSCADYRFRRAATHGLCRHGRALKAHLDAKKACPQCGGRGFYLCHFDRYASGSEPIPCATCSGSGKRATADPKLAAMWDRERAEERDRQLREMFK